MRRTFGEQKPTNVQVKEEREEVIQSISSLQSELAKLKSANKAGEKLNLELSKKIAMAEANLAKTIADSNKALSELNQINEIIKKRERNLTEKNTELLTIKEIIDNQRVGKLSESQKEITTRKAELDNLKAEIKSLEKQKDDAEEQAEEAQKRETNIASFGSQRESQLANLVFQLKQKKKEIESADVEIERIEQIKKEIAEAERKKAIVEQEEEQVRQEIKAGRRELMSIESERRKKMGDLDEREKKLTEKENGLLILEQQLKAKEKKIKELSGALQRHFDTQQIPIKV